MAHKLIRQIIIKIILINYDLLNSKYANNIDKLNIVGI